MSSVLHHPGTPQWMAELITLIYLGPLEQRPWQSFLYRLRSLTGGDVAMLWLSPTTPGHATTMHWNAAPSVMEHMQHGERYSWPGRTGDYLVDISRRSVQIRAIDPAFPPPNAAAYSQECMRIFGIKTFVSVHGERMACCLGRIDGAFGDAEKQILRLLTPHLNRA